MRNFTHVCVCWILICTTQIYAQQRCDILRITGTSLRHHMGGRYQILPSGQQCSGRQAYKQDGGNNYLYYRSVSSVMVWLAGPDFCVDTATLRADDTTLNPEDITATWDELDANLNWVPSSGIQVLCDTGDFQGCQEVRVRNAQWNTLVEGRYQAMVNSPLCYGTYTYKHVSKDLYLYSDVNWYIDDENCDDSLTAEVYARFQDGAFYPEDILAAGEEPSTFSAWVKTELDIQCSGSGAKSRWFGLTAALVIMSLGLK